MLLKELLFQVEEQTTGKLKWDEEMLFSTVNTLKHLYESVDLLFHFGPVQCHGKLLESTPSG